MNSDGTSVVTHRLNPAITPSEHAFEYLKAQNIANTLRHKDNEFLKTLFIFSSFFSHIIFITDNIYEVVHIKIIWNGGYKMRKKKDEQSSLHKNEDRVLLNLFSELPEFSFRGNREVVIEGSRGVLNYSEEIIRLNTSTGLVSFEGRNLNLKCISSSELIINGFITKVEFVV